MVTIIIKDFLLQLFREREGERERERQRKIVLKFVLTYEYSNDEIKPECQTYIIFNFYIHVRAH